MSVAAVMLVKDEVDIVGYTIEHLARQVDGIYVSDNGSTDGTRELLDYHERESGVGCLVYDDPDPGYYQAEKTSALARKAYDAGFDWVVPVDADELWRCADGSKRITEFLSSLPPAVVFAKARLYDHKVTALDPEDEPNPFRRMGYRFVESGSLPKVAARLSAEIRIGMGNHEAETFRGAAPVSSTGRSLSVDDYLIVEHYTWRSEEQFLRKIRNGYRAYAAAPELDAAYGAHWRAFGDPDDDSFEDRVRSWFRQWAYSPAPDADPSIGYFPAPIG